ncbi:MAG: hypothetical protein ABI120_04515 [Gemmatimonadaceae bacterium]
MVSSSIETPSDCILAGSHGLDTLSMQIFERFIGARTPEASPADRQLRARMMQGITEGVAMRAAQYAVSERPPLFRELRLATTAYLAVYER